MSLKLKVISGSEKGSIFDLKPGAILGRGQADILLSDSKISGQHARVEKDGESGLVLVDLGSTNGLRVRGKRKPKVALSPGTVIRIGRIEVEVIIGEKANLQDAPPPPPKVEADSSTKPRIEPAPQTWREYLADFSRQAKSKFKDTPREVLPFRPLVTLRVVRGLQVGTEWVLGYGPRRVGLGSLDLHLFDPKAPLIAFTVTPDKAKAMFHTEHPSSVRLNGRGVSTETLSDGDVIEIGETVIKVGFRK